MSKIGWSLLIITMIAFVVSILTCPPSECKPIGVWWMSGLIAIILGVVLIVKNYGGKE